MNSKHIWKDNSVQFPRLLAEIRAAGITTKQEDDICESMDITRAELNELLERADQEFDRLKERIAPMPKFDLSKATEKMAFYEIDKKVRVDIGWIGEGNNGDYDPDDPKDVPRLRFDVTDLTRKKRDSQDNSFCTSLTPRLPSPILIAVCRHIAHEIVNEPHWKRVLEELSWTSDSRARWIHYLARRRKKNGSP